MSEPLINEQPDALFDWPGASGPLHWRWFRGVDEARSDALVVFFRPGGFMETEVEASDRCLRVVAEACRVNIVAPSYALAPAQPFPAAIEDAHAVLSQVFKHRSALRWSGKYLFAGGVEAGGNLAAVSALLCRDRQGPKLAGQILIMPMLDASMHCSSMRDAVGSSEAQSITRAIEHSYRCYLPRPADRSHPYASPLQATRLAGLPPALVIHAEGDPLGDEALRYADKLEAAGVAVTRAMLPTAHVRTAEERCNASADDPGIQAMAAFLRPYTNPISIKHPRVRKEPAAPPAPPNPSATAATSATSTASTISSDTANGLATSPRNTP